MDVGPLLAIDTSGATASVALYWDRVLAEMAWYAGRSHSTQLLPAIDTTLRLGQTDKRSLGAIAVAAGPGSYSGLRVGAATAAALALALDIGVTQVPTLEVLAWSHGSPASVRPAIDVGRGHYATARFRRREQWVEQETELRSVGLGELVELAAREGATLIVDLDPRAREQTQREYGPRVELASPAASVRRAGFLAELAALKIRRGESVPNSRVEPIYLS